MSLVLVASSLGQKFTDFQSNRGLDFGDGLFETIIIHNNTIRFLNLHYDRLMNGFNTLGFKKKDFFSSYQLFEEKFLFLFAGLMDSGTLIRVKMKIWRKGAGAYHSNETDFDWVIEAKKIEPPKSYRKEKIGISTFITQGQAFKGCKTLNALNYVLASNQANAKSWDDALLLDAAGNIGECTSSNIFWIKNGKVFTPSSQAGFVQGVMKQHVLALLTDMNIPFFEVLEKPDTLKSAVAVFGTNVLGVFAIKQIEESVYQPDELIVKLQELTCIK